MGLHKIAKRIAFNFYERIALNITSTDRTLSILIRDICIPDLAALVPSEFSGGSSQLYDTNPKGKGFDSGYVSFALKANSLINNYLIGGILFKLKYDINQYRSETPTNGVFPQGQKHSKGTQLVIFNVEAGYYNKLAEGGYSLQQNLGEYTIEFDDQEQITSSTFIDTAKATKGINNIINIIMANPPVSAQSSRWRAINQPSVTMPTTSLRAFHKWLLTQKNQHDPATQLAEIYGSQINNLAQALSAGSGNSFQTELAKVTNYFQSRGWTIDHNK